MIQRSYQKLKQILTINLSADSPQWHKYVNMAVMAHSTTYHQAIRCTPTEIFHRRVPFNALDIQLGKSLSEQPNTTDVTRILNNMGEKIFRKHRPTSLKRFTNRKHTMTKKHKRHPSQDWYPLHSMRSQNEAPPIHTQRTNRRHHWWSVAKLWGPGRTQRTRLVRQPRTNTIHRTTTTSNPWAVRIRRTADWSRHHLLWATKYWPWPQQFDAWKLSWDTGTTPGQRQHNQNWTCNQRAYCKRTPLSTITTYHVTLRTKAQSKSYHVPWFLNAWIERYACTPTAFTEKQKP